MKNLFIQSSSKPLIHMLGAFSFFMFSLFIWNTVIPLYTQTDVIYKNSAEREDFVRVYAGANIAAMGNISDLYRKNFMVNIMRDNMALSEEQMAHVTPWLYPPVWFLLLQPLAHLSYKTTFAVWIVINMALFYAVSYGFVWRKPIEGLLIWSPACFAALSWGQNGVITAALYIAAFRFLFSAPTISGIMFGICIIKPQMGFLVPLFLLFGGHYKVAIFAAISSLLFIGLSVAIYGFDPWISYFHVTMQGGKQLDLSIGYAMPSIYNFARSLGISTNISAIIQMGTLAASIFMLWKIRHHKNSMNLLFYVSALTLISFPYFGIYDYTLVTAALLGILMAHNINKPINIGRVLGILVIYFSIIIHPIILQLYGIIIVPALLGILIMFLTWSDIQYSSCPFHLHIKHWFMRRIFRNQVI